MAAAPVAAAALVNSIECAVSLVPAPAITGTVTASATARQSDSFSSSVRTETSPVDPATTSPSEPWSTSHRARSAAASRSRAPPSSKGVTMAVSRPPNRAGGSEPSIDSGYQGPPRDPLDAAPAGAGHRALRDLAGDGRAVGEGVLVLGRVAQVLE